jgi:hypothetical protein
MPSTKDAPSETKEKQSGIENYYRSKIAELEVQERDSTQNLRRLEAQRNDLNSKGTACDLTSLCCLSRIVCRWRCSLIFFFFFFAGRSSANVDEWL